jgi:TRAP-type C4-dicarboxylate transport system permease small subunit
MLWRTIDTGLGWAERAFIAGANGLLLGMLAINLANILLRLAIDKGIIWVFPWTGVLFVWSIFLAFFVIFRRGQDIAIDILTRRLPPRLAAAIEAFVACLVIGLMLVILWQAPTLIPKQVGRIDLVGIQRYWLAAPLWVSCALIALQYLLNLRISVLKMGGSQIDGDRSGAQT